MKIGTTRDEAISAEFSADSIRLKKYSIGRDFVLGTTRDEAISAEFGADSIRFNNIQSGVTLCQVFCPIGGTNVQKTMCFLTFWADSVTRCVKKGRVFVVFLYKKQLPPLVTVRRWEGVAGTRVGRGYRFIGFDYYC